MAKGKKKARKARSQGRRAAKAIPTPRRRSGQHQSVLRKSLLTVYSTASRFFLHSWKLLGAIALLIGLVQGYFFFTSRLSASPGPAFRPSDPFTSAFTLSNDGQFSIYDVEFLCLHNQTDVETRVSIQNIATNPRIFNVQQVRANERTTTTCPRPALNTVERADVSIVARYRPAFTFWQKTQRFRFVTAQQSDGTFQWLPMAAKLATQI